MDEKNLVKSLQNKETKNEAFRFLVREYKSPMYRFIRKIVIDHHDTDEVVQLTYIKVFKYIDGFRGTSKLQTWIYTIARNEAYSFLKSKAKERNTSIEELCLSSMMTLQANSEFYTGDEIQLRLQTSVAQLPQKQKEVFNMKYFDKLKYKDIAEITGTSEGGLKANYFLAVKRLKEILQQV